MDNSIFFFEISSDDFVVDTINPISQIDICIELTSIGKVSKSLMFQIEVCGNEKISVSSSSTIKRLFSRYENGVESISIAD